MISKRHIYKIIEPVVLTGVVFLVLNIYFAFVSKF